MDLVVHCSRRFSLIQAGVWDKMVCIMMLVTFIGMISDRRESANLK